MCVYLPSAVTKLVFVELSPVNTCKNNVIYKTSFLAELTESSAYHSITGLKCASGLYKNGKPVERLKHVPMNQK